MYILKNFNSFKNLVHCIYIIFNKVSSYGEKTNMKRNKDKENQYFVLCTGSTEVIVTNVKLYANKL